MALCVFHIILFFSYCFDLSLGVLDVTAVLLECEKDSSKNDAKRQEPPYYTLDNCTRKIRINLTISNNGKTPTDFDYAFLGKISDPDTGADLYLLNPIVLRLRQDQVILAYPFHYLSAVNGKASEIVVNYENRKNFTGCDDLSRINPTCGLKHEKGKAVRYSEGFCCYCPEAPVKEKQARGGQDCSLNLGSPVDFEKQKYKASAHCLQFSDVWYTVSALSEPFILHETYMQVYNQRHLNNGSSVWVALTHDEDFELGSQNVYQYDDSKQIVISYFTEKPKKESITVPFAERRLLTPQPMPAVPIFKIPTPIMNGASDYLLIPKTLINPDGVKCDVAGVSYEAFANQPDRCYVPKDTCLKNQPLDFWEMDDEKRKSGSKGSYLLQNFGTPYKDPIIVNPDTKEHWLGIEYYEPHQTTLFIEINTDKIVIMSVGRDAQISKILSSIAGETISISVSVLNRGLMAAEFTIQAVKCAYGVPDSSKESIVIPPQFVENVIVTTKPGSTSLYEKFSCTVQVSSEMYGVVAKRKVAIHPQARCVCNFYCKCVCMSESLKCKAMSEEDFQAAGFRGSLPVLTAKPPYRIWFVAHPYLAILAIVLFLLLFGLIKAVIGAAGCKKVGHYGMENFLYQPKKIKQYLQPRLKNVPVQYDADGYPIHPVSGKRVPVISDELLAAFNLLFFFHWPILKCREGVEKVSKKKGKQGIQRDTEVTSPKEESRTQDKVSRFSPKYWFSRKEENKDKDKHPGTNPKRKDKQPVSDNEAVSKKGGFMRGFHKPRPIISESAEELSSGPAADPLNKELQHWRKGKTKIQAAKK